MEQSFTVALNGSWFARSLYTIDRWGDTDRGLRGPCARACRLARNNNRKFYAPGQCDIKLSVRSNNRTEQPGLNAGQSLATRDNGADGQRPINVAREVRSAMPRDQTSMLHPQPMCLLRRTHPSGIGEQKNYFIVTSNSLKIFLCLFSESVIYLYMLQQSLHSNYLLFV